MKKFLLNEAHWLAASRRHSYVWETKEQSIFSLMCPNVSLEGIEAAGGYYRVGRHFPITRRQNLLEQISGVTCRGSSPSERFASYVKSVRRVANSLAKNTEHGRQIRPISGVSKLLWYRFPLHGFIYDSQVLAAICRNGLTVRFDAMMRSFGGSPLDSHEWNFLIAAAAYQTFALPLHEIVANVFRQHGLEARRAARLLDMLFWIEGGPSGKLQINSSTQPDVADAIGLQAFRRCRSIISSALSRS
jgi:hypothetical protein